MRVALSKARSASAAGGRRRDAAGAVMSLLDGADLTKRQSGVRLRCVGLRLRAGDTYLLACMQQLMLRWLMEAMTQRRKEVRRHARAAVQVAAAG